MPPGYPPSTPRTVTSEEDASVDDKILFNSHSTKDKPVATLLQRSLILGGVPIGRIFYSSARLTGIPAGEDVGAYLRQSLRDAGLVISLLSPAYLTSPRCCMELGAAWVTGTPTFPIVVPPLTIDEAIRAVGNDHMLSLKTGESSEDIFSELYDRITDNLGIHLRHRQLSDAVREFDNGLADALSTAA
jgi:TIR domain-containing protein